MDNEVIGWILDAHLCSTQQEILVWIATEAGPVVEHRETWHPTFHVSGNRKDLQNLIDWLWQPELRLRYGIESYAFEMKRTELGPSICNICSALRSTHVQHCVRWQNTSMRVVNMYVSRCILLTYVPSSNFSHQSD